MNRLQTGMAKRTSVVISQSQTSNPAKRQLEEDIVAGLLLEPGIDVTVIPNLYDLTPQDTGVLALAGITGNLVLCSWLFERAAHWVLDRHGVQGQSGVVLLRNDDEEEGEDEVDENLPNDSESTEAPADKARVTNLRPPPNRKIYCLDLRVSNKASDYVEEVKRIHRENAVQVVSLGLGISNPKPIGQFESKTAGRNGNSEGPASPVSSATNIFFPHQNGVSPEALSRFHHPTNDTALPLDGLNADASSTATVQRYAEVPDRRWYPVIDYSRCTNCMECIDFCLFGVYGVDRVETILVEQPDNCRKGCPACSRVCPENAIMFPQHKTPAIAGSNESTAALKIDLSQLFGAPADDKSALEVAAAERDEQLMLAGREAVGMSVGVPKRHAAKRTAPRDRLDALVDELDSLDL